MFYLCSSAILGYVIHEVTGQTPLEYATAQLFPALGIAGAVQWTPAYGADGINECGHGLYLPPLSLAKLGLLYRQRGVPAPGAAALLSSSFVDDSVTNQLTVAMSPSDTRCASFFCRAVFLRRF